MPWRRRVPEGLTPSGGSMYWALARDGAERVLHLVETRPDWVAFYRRAWIPDEQFFQSLVVSGAGDLDVRSLNLTHIVWQPGSPHPRTFRSADLPELTEVATAQAPVTAARHTLKVFARKFDSTVDGAVLDALDGADFLATAGPVRPAPRA